MQTEEKIISDLNEAEKNVVFRMRNLKPYERVEIKLNDNKYGEYCITSSMTIKEVFNQ